MPTSRSASRPALLAALVAAATLACSPRAPSSATPTPTPSAPSGAAATPAAPASVPQPAATPSAGAAAGWTLGARGAGPVRFGMTLEELRDAVALEPLGPPGECAYVVPEGAPEGLAFMVFEGRVVRADIRRGSGAPNALGVRTGDREERALELLGPAAEVTPHKYVEGHYLTAPTGEGDTYWVVETDRERVTDVRAGLMPQVRWVEGCS